MNQAFYIREVLGVKNYLCPERIQKLRKLEGAWPAQVLVIVFEFLTDSQKSLLKKIMSSLGFCSHSLLTIQDRRILKEFFREESCLAEFIFIFGAGEKLSLKNQPGGCHFFQSAYSLKELEGGSIEIRQKKQNLWKELKLWKESLKLK